MSKDYQVWGTIESTVSSYMTLDSDGNIVPDNESREIVQRKLIARLLFFNTNALLTKSPFSEDGSLADQSYSASDFTGDGLALCNRKVDAWLNSKASSKNPPDMKMLERSLAEIRRGK